MAGKEWTIIMDSTNRIVRGIGGNIASCYSHSPSIFRIFFFGLGLLCDPGMMAQAEAIDSLDSGNDVVAAFAKTHRGTPLRVVALGGSITQAGKGWVGQWLQERFPDTVVSMVNAGMSGTGSELGVFRLERDVISFQPDLVLIEFAVNDDSRGDEIVIRCLESIVVRLKELPHAPAIVFIQAAAQDGSNRIRHQKVAAHYGLLNIDLQSAVDAHLLKEDLPWETFFKDKVHPNEAGHAFYTQVIARALEPYLQKSRETSGSIGKASLPAPLSQQALWLDGRMIPVDATSDWARKYSLPYWWTQFFQGFTWSETLGAKQRVPLRGTFIGMLYPRHESFGAFYASLDGQESVMIDQSLSRGYKYTILARDATPGVHLAEVVVARPPTGKMKPVHLGYWLVAGETASPSRLAEQNAVDTDAMAKCSFQTVAAK